jgi:hypothetical protein
VDTAAAERWRQLDRRRAQSGLWIARRLLSGRTKKRMYVRLAKRRLLSLVPRASRVLASRRLALFYAYLGYAHDHLGDRKEAKRWFAQALAEPDAPPYLKALAKRGLAGPGR